MWGYLAFILRPLNSSGYMGMELSTPLGDTCSKICELVPLGVVGRRLCGISSCYSNCSEVSSISSSVSLSHLICWDCLSDSLLWLPSLCAGRQLCWLRLASGVTINIVVGKKKTTNGIFQFVMSRGRVPTPQRSCARFHEIQLISTDSPSASTGRWRNLV